MDIFYYFCGIYLRDIFAKLEVMKVAEEYRSMDGEGAWKIVVDYVKEHGQITTMTGIVLSATFVGSCIFIKGGTPGTKRYEKGEYLTGKDFIRAYDIVKGWDNINTGNVKEYIKRQQTPFIALLHNAEIIK